jgi:hypothetical protein
MVFFTGPLFGQAQFFFLLFFFYSTAQAVSFILIIKAVGLNILHLFTLNMTQSDMYKENNNKDIKNNNPQSIKTFSQSETNQQN